MDNIWDLVRKLEKSERHEDGKRRGEKVGEIN
jgi:hypothetical protein